MARVTRRPEAKADIFDIWEYIAEDSIGEADRWMERLEETLALWATQPMMGRARDELAPRVRSFAFGRYTVIFEAVTGGIDVVRVVHGSRDIDSIFES